MTHTCNADASKECIVDEVNLYLVGHCAPGVILWSRLGVPHITCAASTARLGMGILAIHIQINVSLGMLAQEHLGVLSRGPKTASQLSAYPGCTRLLKSPFRAADLPTPHPRGPCRARSRHNKQQLLRTCVPRQVAALQHAHQVVPVHNRPSGGVD